MNKIKTGIYAFTIGILFCVTHASAQKLPAAERAKEITFSMNCELGMRSAQMLTVNGINLRACLKMDSLEMAYPDDVKAYRQAGVAVDKERDRELRDALTPKQFSVYERISKGNHHAIRRSAGCRKSWRIDETSCS